MPEQADSFSWKGWGKIAGAILAGYLAAQGVGGVASNVQWKGSQPAPATSTDDDVKLLKDLTGALKENTAAAKALTAKIDAMPQPKAVKVQ